MTAINLNGVELVESFVGVEVSGLRVQEDQNEKGISILVDNSQGNLEVARGKHWNCNELLRTIKVLKHERVILFVRGICIYIQKVEFAKATAKEFAAAVTEDKDEFDVAV